MKPRVLLALSALLLFALPLVTFASALEPSATVSLSPTPHWWLKVFLVLLLVAFSGVYFHGRRLRARR